MSGIKIGMPGGSVSMSNRTADKLISGGSGDAALLFLHLLREHGYYDIPTAAKALVWPEDRVAAAFRQLENMELVRGVEAEVTPAVSTKDAPEYTSEDIGTELSRSGSAFPGLLAEVERRLGSKLSYQGTRILMELYDYLALPSEVIYLLVCYLAEDYETRKGPGQMPRMSEVKREGYRWAQKGLDNLEAATAYVEKMKYFRTAEGRILSIFGITGRSATNQERSYINSWLEMGFDEGAIQQAYEKTVLNTGSWRWNYGNSILKSWHKKGLHTEQEVLSEDRPTAAGTVESGSHSMRGRQVQPAANALSPDSPQLDDVAWLQEFMKNHG